MTAKPFKFRYVNEIAGAFAVTVVLLLLGLILISGQLQGWFERKRICEVVLPETFGLRTGSEVRILGARAGTVQSVRFRRKASAPHGGVWDAHPEDLELVAGLEIRGEHTVFVGRESVVHVKTGLVGLGATYLEISPAKTPAPDLRELPLAPLSSNMQQDMTGMVEEIRDSVLPAIRQIEFTTREIEVLVKTLNDPDKDLLAALSGVRDLVEVVNRGKSAAGLFLRDEITGEDLRSALADFRKVSASLVEVLAGLERGDGVAGTLLTDEEAQKQFENTLAEMSRAVESANTALALIAEAAAVLPDTVQASDRAIKEYTTVAKTLEETVREYEIVGEALQRHWLLRKYVQRDENPVALPRGATPPPSSEVSVSGRNDLTRDVPSQSGESDAGRSRSGFRGLFGGGREEKSQPSNPAKETPPVSGSRSKTAAGIGLR